MFWCTLANVASSLLGLEDQTHWLQHLPSLRVRFMGFRLILCSRGSIPDIIIIDVHSCHCLALRFFFLFFLSTAFSPAQTSRDDLGVSCLFGSSCPTCLDYFSRSVLSSLSLDLPASQSSLFSSSRVRSSSLSSFGRPSSSRLLNPPIITKASHKEDA